jgi:Spy/CpxP family protein refolding chaperone
MRRPAAIGVVITLFLVGVVVGALGADLVAHRRGQRPGGGNGAGGHNAAAELQRRLDLSPDQRRQVDTILADSHRDAAALWEEVRPRLMTIVENGNDRIEKILTPSQKPEFQRYRAERLGHVHHLVHGLGPAGHLDRGSGAPPPH